MNRRTAFAGAIAATALAAMAVPGAASAGHPRFHVVALPGGAGHTEPSLVVDGDGRAFVSAIPGIATNTTSGELGSPIWRSRDYVHWEKLATASVGPAGSPLGGGDSALAVDDKGDLFMTDLWLGDDSIAISEDHGDSFVGGPVSHRLADDRTWLAFSAKDQALYQVYDGLDGLYVARADLDTPLGAKAAMTFVVNTRVVAEVPLSGPALDALPVRQAVAPPGGIAVDPKTGAVYVTYSDTEGVAVAVSVDEGLTWSIDHIPGSGTTGSYLDTSWNFVPVATDAAGGLYVLWSQAAGKDVYNPDGIALRLATSADHGRTWHVRTLRADATALLPALAVRTPGHASVAWVETRGRGNPNAGGFGQARWSLRYAEVATAGRRTCETTYTVDGQVHTGTLFAGPQGGDRGMGDFLQIATTRRNGALVAYTRGEEGGAQAMAAYLPPHHAHC